MNKQVPTFSKVLDKHIGTFFALQYLFFNLVVQSNHLIYPYSFSHFYTETLFQPKKTGTYVTANPKTKQMN